MARVTCTTCKIEQNQDCFYKDRTTKTGYRKVCKKCCGRQYAFWQKNNKDKVRTNNNKNYHRFKNTKEYRYWRTKASAKQRKIDFLLEEKEFYQLIQSKCYYCGCKERIGIDRIDSSLSYSSANVLPCCYRCNVAKNNMSVDEFISLCKRIAKYADRNTL